jgi:molybdate transport system substrate-binding protein
MFSLFPVLLLVSFLTGLHFCQAGELRVAAAASLADVLKEVNAAFEKETGHKVRVNVGASSLLARQIEEGAPVDVFFSADEAKMDALEKQGRIEPGTRVALLTNALVVVVPVDSGLVISEMKALAGPAVRRVATGDPKSVPVGIYARAHLEKLGVWAAVQPKVVSMDNVRTALAAVESGNVDAGIVYQTDAAVSRKVKIACSVPAVEGPRIVYPVAMVKGAANAGPAQAWLAFLKTPGAEAVFRKFGFGVLPAPASKP